MEKEIASAVERGRDPTGLAFILHGTVNAALGCFELQRSGVLARDTLHSFMREHQDALAPLVDPACCEQLPGCIPVVVRLDDFATVLSLPLYTPASIGDA